MSEYTTKLCADCYMMDILRDGHGNVLTQGYCRHWKRSIPVMHRHEPPHICPYYEELFDCASRGITPPTNERIEFMLYRPKH